MIFYAKRPNDVSNNTCPSTPCLEESIVRQFNTVSSRLQAKWLSSSGYPDIEIIDSSTGNPIGYIEVKATAREDMRSPRDFYVSPGKVISVVPIREANGDVKFNVRVRPRLTRYKIRNDAPHIMVLVKIERAEKCPRPPEIPPECICWRVTWWNLYDLYYLELRTKIEFNTDYYEIINMCPRL
ncbi:hypothetical protein [Pyrococcus yayanosii]|uniref:hypothetical protein n=1 Tax=Pyrococcus yayanosii TaxID=1008460 RepID=UPI001305196F|nr:hypothetical protein [Pyrococcus yayanosii]